ncbi:MAG: DoxX family protein [Chitinophagales bacterium]
MKLLSYESSTKWIDIGLLLLRITFGAAMLYGHGIGKWGKLFGGEEIQFADPFGLGVVASLGLAVFAEVICSILLMFGLFTRLALVPLMVTMAVAYFTVHFSDEFAKQEKAILYGITYLALFLTGPGRMSLDALLFGKKQS